MLNNIAQNASPSILCAGEVMVEFVVNQGNWQQAYGGDTFNTAIYLARQGMAVEYFTSLGDDHFSDDIIKRLESEKVAVENISRKAKRQPGLYTIHNDHDGERDFSYWRANSPARELFDTPYYPAKTPNIFYFSGITLAVTRSGFAQLITLLNTLRKQQCTIIFDPNYRPKLWDSAAQAQHFYQQVLTYCHMVLPTLDDDTQLWGITSIEECRALYRRHGVTELVIKAPQLFCHVFAGDVHLKKQATEVTAVDTTGAGDAFNAAYIASRCAGEAIETAISKAQQLSSLVVQHSGALLP